MIESLIIADTAAFGSTPEEIIDLSKIIHASPPVRDSFHTSTPLIENIPVACRNVIGEFCDLLLEQNPGNIRAIVLFGGLVRDRAITPAWSDIDLIIVFEQIQERDSAKLASLIGNLEDRYALRLDIAQIDIRELTDPLLLPAFSNGAIINALTYLPTVGMLLHGNLPTVTFSDTQIASAQIGYITTTLSAFREYLIEVLYRKHDAKQRRDCIPRLIRWTFSIIRASLRLFGIWTHPYADSVSFLNRIFPEIETQLLDRLIDIRSHFDEFSASDDSFLFHDIEAFVEEFVPFIMSRYYERHTPNTHSK